MRNLVLFLLMLIAGVAEPLAAAEWQSLFNGRDLTGWRANVMPESFRVVNGVIRVQATRESAHLFYVGKQRDGFVRFKNFEFEATVRSEANSNSGIYFHTDMSVSNAKNHLAKGYEIQLNSQKREKRRTGSLYAVVDLDRSPVDESQWFRVRLTVKDRHIVVHLNDSIVVDYTEPANVKRPKERAGRVLNPNGGAIALQAHDPGSVFFFKDLRIRPLP